MTKKKKISSVNQPSLFDFVKEAIVREISNGQSYHRGSLDITRQIKEALSDDLRHARDEHGRDLSRAQVAAAMTDMIGEEITLSTLNNWTASSHPHEIPLSFFPAFVRATGGQRRAADVISRHCGLFLMPGPEAVRAEIRKQDEIMEQAKQDKREWVTLLKRLEGK